MIPRARRSVFIAKVVDSVLTDPIAGFRSSGALELLRRQRRAHAGGGQHRKQVSVVSISELNMLCFIH